MRSYEKDRRFEKTVSKLASSILTVLHHEPVPWAQPNDCYANCAKQVREYGGEIKYGWVFCGRFNDGYVIASPHAVWQSPSGDIIDITPNICGDKNLPPNLVPPVRDTEGRLVFLPDDEAKNRPNKYLPLYKDKDLVRACRRLNQKEWRLNQDDEAIANRVATLHRSVKEWTGK